MSSTVTVYRVPPLQEFKAVKELRQAGFKAYLPVEIINGRRHPVARGYVSATGKPYEAKHVRQSIGDVPRGQLIRLYPSRDRGHKPMPPVWVAGDRVEIKIGPFASLFGALVRKRGRRQWTVDVDGRHISVQTKAMIRIDPG